MNIKAVTWSSGMQNNLRRWRHYLEIDTIGGEEIPGKENFLFESDPGAILASEITK